MTLDPEMAAGQALTTFSPSLQTLSAHVHPLEKESDRLDGDDDLNIHSGSLHHV